MFIFSIVRDTPLSVERVAQAEGGEASIAMDEQTFRAFYDRTARAVWVYLSRITGDSHLADDLLQEAYFRFLRAGSVYESEAHSRNALFQIATNLARDAARRSVRRGFHVSLSDEPDEHDLAVDQNAADRVVSRTDLASALGRLRLQEREMLWLAYAQGFSHEEIAQTLGLKAASIRLLLFRARKKLAALLGGTRRREGGSER